MVDTATKCASLSQAQGVELLLPNDHLGVDALLPGAAAPQLATQVLSSLHNLDNLMAKRQAWKVAQNQSDSCKAAISHLQSSKVPSNKKGDLYNKIRHYVRHGILASDGLLVTEGDQSIYAPGDPKTKIVVPHHLAAGLLFHLHNNIKFAEHPSMSQLKQTFNRNFHTWNLSPLLEELYKIVTPDSSLKSSQSLQPPTKHSLRQNILTDTFTRM